nr:hypothetical protein [Tanacetum cinerariifolium]
HLGAYDLGVTTPRALVYAGVMINGYARSCRATATPRGGRTSRQTGRGGGRTRGRSGDQGNGKIDGQGGQVGGQGSKVNDGVDGVHDFSTIIPQQLHNLLLTIVTQVGSQGSDHGNGRNVIGNNDRMGCTYKEFLSCNPKEYDVKREPPSSDRTPTSPNPTPVSPLTNEEFEVSVLSNTRITSSHSTAPPDSTTPLSLEHPLTYITPTLTLSWPLYYRRTAHMVVHTQPAMSPGLSARVTKLMTLSLSSFRKRYKSSYETPSSSLASSLTLPVRKRYRGTSELVEDIETEAASVEVTTTDMPLWLGYEAAKRHALELAKEIAPSTFQVGHSSRSVLEHQRINQTPTPRLPTHAILVDLVDVTAYTYILIFVPPVHTPVLNPSSLKWSSGKPTSVELENEGFLAELGAQLGSLERAQEQATITFGALWRLVLAFEAWTGHKDAHRAAMWQARYEDHRLIDDLLVQKATIQRKLKEMRDRVTTLDQERSRREQ